MLFKKYNNVDYKKKNYWGLWKYQILKIYNSDCFILWGLFIYIKMFIDILYFKLKLINSE